MDEVCVDCGNEYYFCTCGQGEDFYDDDEIDLEELC